MRRADPLIVGGGPAGAAAAIHLARAGAQPLIVERQPEGGDALCGGFLSWRTLERLEALGLPPAALGGHEVRALRILTATASWELPLPGLSMGLSRARLDQMLRARAVAEGATVRQAAAREYAIGTLRLDSGEALNAGSLFLATGKHELRGLARPAGAAGGDPMLGLRLRLPASHRTGMLLGGHIEMHLFGGGYLGLILQEDGGVNACMAVRKSRLAQAGNPGDLFRALAASHPALAERLSGMPAAPDIDAVGHIPYGWRARATEPGVFRLGDQAGVIASLAGEGIGIALASAELAVECWRGGGTGAAVAYQKVFHRRLRGPVLAGEAMAALARRPEMARVPLALLARLGGVARLLAQATRMA